MPCNCNGPTTTDAPVAKEEMVQVDLEQSNGVKTINGTNLNGAATPVKRQSAKANGINGHHHNPATAKLNPYAPRYADFLSNVSNFNIIESTLRGQFALRRWVFEFGLKLMAPSFPRGRAVRQRILR